MSHSELAGRNRPVSGQDRKFPPAPGTNQIAGVREFRPLTSQEKNNEQFFYIIFLIIQYKIVRTLRIRYKKFFFPSKTAEWLLKAHKFKQLYQRTLFTPFYNTKSFLVYILWINAFCLTI